MNMENKIKEAVEILGTALKEDEDYYNSWKANIAMSFYDEVCINPVRYMDENNWHKIADDAADNFLNLLIK